MNSNPYDVFNQKVSLIYEYDNKSPLFARVADIELERNNIDEAIQILTDGITHHPDFSVAYFLLGKAHTLKGNYGQALKFVKKGSELIHSDRAADPDALPHPRAARRRGGPRSGALPRRFRPAPGGSRGRCPAARRTARARRRRRSTRGAARPHGRAALVDPGTLRPRQRRPFCPRGCVLRALHLPIKFFL